LTLASNAPFKPSGAAIDRGMNQAQMLMPSTPVRLIVSRAHSVKRRLECEAKGGRLMWSEDHRRYSGMRAMVA
jgi:hypothetical protein